MTPEQIIKEVCKYYNTTYEYQYENRKDRHPEFTRVRHMCFLFMRSHTFLSRREIGAFFGNNHSTVYLVLQKMQNWIDTEKELHQEYEDIKELLKHDKESIDTLWKLAELFASRLNRLHSLNHNGIANGTIKEMERRMVDILEWAKKFGITC